MATRLVWHGFSPIWEFGVTVFMARQAASHGHKPKFKIPVTNLFLRSQRSLKVKFLASLENDFYHKGTLYHTHFFNPTLLTRPWYSHIPLPRDQIVTINRLRSNHYNLNLSLYRKISQILLYVNAGTLDRMSIM